MASSAMLTSAATATATSIVAVTETSKTPLMAATTTTGTTTAATTKTASAASVGKPSAVTTGTEGLAEKSAAMLDHDEADDDDDDDCKDDDVLNTSLCSCANDPDFAVICAFLQKFAKELGLELPNFKRLQEWLTNTDEVANPIRDLHIKLLRKTRKTVHEKSWESAISKFCFTYSAQDGWELERFGYKQASLKVKLRLLRELLESQFERNNKFRNKILTLSADSLRSQPIGRDRLGHSYWLTQDDDCNLRIYQEHLDEEIWQVVATNRDEFVNLIARLRGNEVVLPSTDIGVIDEDTSSSNSCNVPVEKPPPPEEKDDSQEDDEAKVVPNLKLKLGEGGAYHHSVKKSSDVGKGEEELAAEEDEKLAQKKLQGQISIIKRKNNVQVEEEEEEEEAEEEGEEEVPRGEGMEEEEEEEGEEAEEEAEEEVDSAEEEQSADEVEEEDSEALAETETTTHKLTNSAVIPSEEAQKKVKPLVISQSKIASSSSAQQPLSTNGCSKKRPLDDTEKTSPRPSEDNNSSTVKKFRPSLLDSKRDKKPSKYGKAKSDEEDDEDVDDDEDDDEDVGSEEEDEADIEDEEGEEEDIDSAAAEEDENEEKDIEDDDDDDDNYPDIENNIVGEAIEDPPVIVRGEGSGKQCEGTNPEYKWEFSHVEDGSIFVLQVEEPEPEVSETIEEEFLYIIGEGNGAESLVGNKNNLETTPETEPATTFTTPTNQTGSNEPKATFFFGEPGCLKLSPIKKAPSKEDEEILQNPLVEGNASTKQHEDKVLLITEKEEEIKIAKIMDRSEENNKDVNNEKDKFLEEHNHEDHIENMLQKDSVEKIYAKNCDEHNEEQIENKSNEQKNQKPDSSDVIENKDGVDDKAIKENLNHTEQSKNKENSTVEKNTVHIEIKTPFEESLNEKSEAGVVGINENAANVTTIPELNGTPSSAQFNTNEKRSQLYETTKISDIDRTEEKYNETTTLEEPKETHEKNGNFKHKEQPHIVEEIHKRTLVENLVPQTEELLLENTSCNKAMVVTEVTVSDAKNISDEIAENSIQNAKESPLQAEPLQNIKKTLTLEIDPVTSTANPIQKCALLKKTENDDKTTAQEATTETSTVVATTPAVEMTATKQNCESIITSETPEVTTKTFSPTPTQGTTEASTTVTTMPTVSGLSASKTALTSPTSTLMTPTAATETKLKLETTATTLNITVPTTAPSQTNRKRRLTDFSEAQKPKIRAHTTSESEIDLPEEHPINLATNDDFEDDGTHVGGKRLKMRAKLTNTEIRKKVEAQKIAAVEETTSSSGEDEALRKRKIISPKRQLLDEKVDRGDSPKKFEKEQLEKQLAELKEEVPAPVIVSPTLPVPAVKQKPTLAEIIEKKLKKTPENTIVKTEQGQETTSSTSGEITEFSSVGMSALAPIKKCPITKPLKKNLLTQIRQEESDEEAIPRKRIIGETVVDNVKQREDQLLLVTTPSDAISIDKSQKIEEPPKVETPARATPDRSTPDRQRKRRSSEEVQHPELSDIAPMADCVGEKLKRNEVHEVTATVKEVPEEEVLPPPIKRLESTQKEDLSSRADEKISLDVSTKEETVETKTVDIKPEVKEEEIVAGSLSGRRSGRRGGTAVIYAELPQPKRTRGGSKAVTVVTSVPKKELTKPKVEADTTKLKKETLPETKKSPSRPDDKKANEVRNESKEVKPVDEEKGSVATVIKAPQSPSVEKCTKTPPKARGRKKREVDTTNIIEAAESETPVRQSRRIAQQKIREEAERRKLEEIALRTMKNELKKKKKAAAQADPTVPEPLEQSSSPDDTDASEIEAETKKLKKKKCPGKDGTWSSGSEEQEEPEEEEEPPHYESDPGSPLFKSDHEFSPESDLEDESQVVPMKRARTARKEDAELNDAKHLDQEEEACQKCGKSDHPEWILLCDNCDKGYHCSCLSPVLFYIPEGDWYCPPCQQEQLIAALEKQLIEFDLIVKQKRLEEEEAQRVAEAERIENERLEAEKRKKKKKKQRGDAKSNDEGGENDESAVGKSDKESEEDDVDDDDEEDSDKKSLKKKEKKGKKNQSNKKRKQRREAGGHRRRRRRAATRGARQRRRNASKSGGSGDSDDSDGTGSQTSNDSRSQSSDSSSSSGSATDSDDEPIYKLRKRRQINVSYRLNEYDDLINSALRKEMDEAALAGNLGRGKDISTIIEADKEEQARQKQLEDGEELIEAASETGVTDSKSANNEIVKTEAKCVKESVKVCADEQKPQDVDSEEEPLKRKAKVKQTLKKKPRKLTTLDISSEEDNASDEDFKGSSLDDDDEDEDTSVSISSNSDSSLEIYRRRGKKGNKKTRKAARRTARERRKVRKFVVDDSEEDEEEETRPKSKKKRKTDSDYTESEESGELSELSENMDSADLCDDTSSSEDSDGAWHPSKRKKQRKSNAAKVARKSPKLKKPQTKKPKRVEYSDDDISEDEEEDYEDEDDDVGMGGKGSGKQPRSVPLKTSNAGKGKGKGKGGAGVGKSSKAAAASKKKKKKLSDYDDDSFSDSEDSTRRTRGRRYAYLEDFEDDSSDGGIKPGVKRPDTPPEEREKFIKKQEEIKRMLAEKNSEGAKLAATPRLTPIKGGTRSPAKPGDSLSTVPLSVIRQAKVLDIDYLQRKGESVSDVDNVDDVDSEFDDADLPDDFPEDMDEDAIARMVEEEEEQFGAAAATRELPAPDDILKPAGSKVKSKEAEKIVPSSASPSIVALSHMHSNAGSGSQSTSFTSGLQEPMRKRLPMPTMHPPLLRHQYPGSGHHHHSLPPHMMQRHTGPPTHLLQNALSAPLGQSVHRNFAQHNIGGAQRGPPGGPGVAARHVLPPHTLAPSQQQLSASQPLPISPGDTETKPRGRRKKITPLRDPLQKQQAAAAASAAATGQPPTTTAGKTGDKHEGSLVTSAAAPGVIKTATSLAIAQPPQLYKAPAGGSSINSSSSQQPSVITRMPHLPPHSAPPGRGMPLGPPGMYASGDVGRFYGPPMAQTSGQPGSRLSPTSSQRHRGPPHVGSIPPHHGMRPSYGPPPPLRGVIGSTNQPPPNSVSGTRPPYPPPPNHGDHHGTQSTGPYGPPPPARHAAPHINPYRPSIFGNPNFGPRGAPPGASMRTTGPPGQEYNTGPPRSYAPYGYYPPPPPLTGTHPPPPTSTHSGPPASHASATSKSSGSAAATRTPTSSTSTSQPPAVPSSVIVSAPPSSIPLTGSNAAVAQQKQSAARAVIKTAPAAVGPQSKPTSLPDVPPPVTPSTSAIVEPRKKLITLETFATSKSPLALSGESSGSRSSPNVHTEGADDSTSASAAVASGGNGQGASEFSGLVSYFSSQHDDYNT